LSKQNKRRTPSDIRFHKKIAGINLLALNNERAESELFYVEKQVKIKQTSGILYIVANPSFKEFIKIGITKDLKKRLNTYQTADPFRKYYVKKYVFIQDVRKIESYLLKEYKIDDVYTGEWVSMKYFDKIRDFMDLL
jgi:predicted GIY-YIG superfamily endonuclease